MSTSSTTIIELLQQPGVRIAVVGVSRDRSKYGNVIYRDLRDKGFDVVAVNPRETEIEGDAVYPSIATVDPPPDIVNIVTPPLVTRSVLQECRRSGLMRVWLQPGAEDAGILELLEEEGFEFLASTCIMVSTLPRSRG